MTELPPDDLYGDAYRCQKCGEDIIATGDGNGFTHLGQGDDDHEPVLHPRLIKEWDTLDEADATLKQVARKLFYAGFDDLDWNRLCHDAWKDVTP
jgi:hypothetical protein